MTLPGLLQAADSRGSTLCRHCRSKTILSRLDQEVEIMHCLHHPHIIRVFDVFREEGRITLVLE